MHVNPVVVVVVSTDGVYMILTLILHNFSLLQVKQSVTFIQRESMGKLFRNSYHKSQVFRAVNAHFVLQFLYLPIFTCVIEP